MKALRLSFWTQGTNWLGQSQRLDGRAVIWGSGSGVRRGPDEFPLGHFRSHQFHRGQLRRRRHAWQPQEREHRLAEIRFRCTTF